jgi:hypothetical protein
MRVNRPQQATTRPYSSARPPCRRQAESDGRARGHEVQDCAADGSAAGQVDSCAHNSCSHQGVTIDVRAHAHPDGAGPAQYDLSKIIDRDRQIGC